MSRIYTKLFLAAVAAVALLALGSASEVSSAWAKSPGANLKDLVCNEENPFAKWDGTNWVCNLGTPGEKGDTGADGNDGAPGADGNDGAPGADGNDGAKGDTGDAGPKGDTGDPGATGDTGDAGPKGDTGDAGAKGDTGDAGPKGDTGDTGPAGGGGAPLPIDCADDEVAKWDGANWVCDNRVTGLMGFTEVVDDAIQNLETLGGLSCTTDQIAKWDGVAEEWVCATAIVGGPKVIFVTSGEWNGDLRTAGATECGGECIDGLAGADALCRAAAVAGGSQFASPPPGDYAAFLSTDTVHALDRLNPGVSGYFLPSGTRVAFGHADLLDGFITHPIDENENFASAGGVVVWTGTLHQGFRATDNCGNWESDDASDTARVGFSNATFTWTGSPAPAGGCSTPHHLYCYQR